MASELLEAAAMTASRSTPGIIQGTDPARMPGSTRRPGSDAPFCTVQALEAMILHLKEAVRADPADARAYCILGVILGLLGREEASLRAWKTASRLSPEDVQIRAGLAAMLGRAGQSAEAQVLLGRLLAENPSLAGELEVAELGPQGRRRSSSDLGRSEHALSGHLGRFALPDLLEFLVSQRSSGIIRLESSERQGAIAMLEGGLIACAAPGGSELDDILIAMGGMSADQPRSADHYRSCVEAPYLLSCVLVEHRLLDPDLLRNAVHAQVESSLSGLLTWKEGRFWFEDLDWAHELPHCATELSADCRQLLLDGVRLLDELQRPASGDLLSLSGRRSRSLRSATAGRG